MARGQPAVSLTTSPAVPAGDAAADPRFSEDMTDAALIAAAIAGDHDAAGTLLRRHYQDCWRFAYRMMGHRHDAEDVVQDTFLRVVRALGKYREQDRFRPWLFRILTNACRTALLQRRRRARWLVVSDGDRIAQLPDTAEPAPDPVTELARQSFLSTALQAALLQLEARQREAFLLKYGEGMEYADMAVVTGAGVSALKMRVKRACDALRPLLGEVAHDL